MTDGQRAVFENDDETISFLRDKIISFQNRILQIESGWQGLQGFLDEYSQLQ